MGSRSRSGVGVLRSVGEPGTRVTGMLSWSVSDVWAVRASQANYHVLLHGGGSQLRPRMCKRRIASARNHFGGLDTLDTVDLIDGAFSGRVERVGRGKVLFISKHARRLRRLERAVGSGGLGRDERL
jgi:hypothetical protein